MKKLLTVFLLALGTVMFVSCAGKDNPAGPGGGGGNSSPTATPTVAITATTPVIPPTLTPTPGTPTPSPTPHHNIVASVVGQATGGSVNFGFYTYGPNALSGTSFSGNSGTLSIAEGTTVTATVASSGYDMSGVTISLTFDGNPWETVAIPSGTTTGGDFFLTCVVPTALGSVPGGSPTSTYYTGSVDAGPTEAFYDLPDGSHIYLKQNQTFQSDNFNFYPGETAKLSIHDPGGSTSTGGIYPSGDTPITGTAGGAVYLNKTF